MDAEVLNPNRMLTSTTWPFLSTPTTPIGSSMTYVRGDLRVNAICCRLRLFTVDLPTSGRSMGYVPLKTTRFFFDDDMESSSLSHSSSSSSSTTAAAAAATAASSSSSLSSSTSSSRSSAGGCLLRSSVQQLFLVDVKRTVLFTLFVSFCNSLSRYDQPPQFPPFSTTTSLTKYSSKSRAQKVGRGRGGGGKGDSKKIL